MFHKDIMQTQSHVEKSMRHRTKKYKSHKKTDIPKQTKQSKNSDVQKNHKHSKFKCINVVSNYLGPDRLTKHVGFLSKGKISNSISRIEKIMSKEVKARAEQDLQEILKLSHCGQNKYRKNGHSSYESVSSATQSLQSIYNSPQYLNHKIGFSNNSWKGKLQNSVGETAINSVLASVHEPQKTSPVKELQLIARKVLLNTIHPFIKQTNDLLFSDRSHIKMMQNKLHDIRKKILPCPNVILEEVSPSIIYENSQISSNDGETAHTQNDVENNFHLNPILTGDIVDQSDFTQIFPSVNEFLNGSNNFITDNDVTNSASDFYNSEAITSQTQSSIGGKSSITLVPISPVTSEDSPVWKLQLSPAKFKPELDTTPTLYFRHKMF